jgi:DNA-binding YbaB/EbfC family protein
MNMQKMMKEMQKMQSKLTKAQSELESQSYEAESGGGMVKVKLSGKGLLESIVINPEAVDPDDVEALEDLVLAAVNKVISDKEAASQNAMGSLTGGMKIPGM